MKTTLKPKKRTRQSYSSYKRRFFTTCIYSIAVVLLGAFLFSCQQEESAADTLIEAPSEISIASPCHIEWVCVTHREPGFRPFFNPWICRNPPITYIDCHNLVEFCFPVLHPCFWIPDIFFDPYDLVKEIDPSAIPDLLDPGYIDPNPIDQYATFKVNKHILGIQYRTPNEGLEDKGSYYIHTTMEIDPELQKTAELEGAVFPAGRYPVLYNKENKTYTAFLSAASYPIVKKSKIASIEGYFEGPVKDLLYGGNPDPQPNAQLVEEKEGFRIVLKDPDPQPMTYLFTPNDLSLGIQYKGGPDALKLESPVLLPKELGKYLGIQTFELNEEYMEVQYDKKSGISTMLFHRGK